MYLPQLNFTRFVAAIAIVIYHFGRYSFPFNLAETKYLMSNLNTLVSYFFILSGFVMVLANTKDNETTIRTDLKTFWLNRLIRLYPLYLVALIFFVIVYGIHKVKAAPFFLSLTLTQSWVPEYALQLNTTGWALSVEIFFYLCFPFLLPFLTKLSNRLLVITSVVLWAGNLLLLHYLLSIHASRGMAFYFPPNHLANFIIGIAAGLLLVRNYKNLQPYNWAFGVTLLLLSSIALYIFITNSPLLKYQHNGSIAPVYLSLLYFLALSKGKWIDFLSNKAFIYLGELSYSIYILQIPVYILFRDYIVPHFHFSMTEGLYVYFLILLPISLFGFEFIEKKARTYLKTKLTI